MVSSIKTLKLYVQETVMMLQKRYYNQMVWYQTLSGKWYFNYLFFLDTLLLWYNETKKTAMIISGGEMWKQITNVSFAYNHQSN